VKNDRNADARAGSLKQIYLITEGLSTDENFPERKAQILDLIKGAIETKISLIQIREKQLSARNVFELTSEAAKLAKNSNTKILVNDRADIALAANADGVHLTANSLSAETIRRNFPKDFLIGVSTHSIEKTEEAKRQGANFAVFGPVFRTPGKGEPKGLEELREICEKVKPFPVIPIGGIDETNYREALEIAGGFAAIRFLNDLENLRKIKEFTAETPRRRDFF
jgi:thiamine-phosphate pyrophosphorylase